MKRAENWRSFQWVTSEWLFVLCLIPIGIFFCVFFRYSGNLPFRDDFDGILEPVARFSRSGPLSLSGFIDIVWTQDDERRIVLDRLVAIGQCIITGRFSFQVQMFIGLLSVPGMLWVFYRVIRHEQLPALLLVSFALLLFNIHYYEAIFWGLIPVQQIAVYFFPLIASYFLARPKTFVFAIIAAILGIFCDVNGSFFLPAGLALLVFQRRWRDAAIWAGVVGLIVFLYFYHLEVPAYRPKLGDNLMHPLLVLTNFFAFSGLAFDFNGILSGTARIVPILALGVATWVLVAVRGWQLGRAALSGPVMSVSRLTVWGGIFHIAVTMAAFAVGRAIEGLDAVLISRYKHVGFLWIILITLLALIPLKNRARPGYYVVYAGWSLLICCFSYFQYLAPLDYYYKERYTDMYEWQHNRIIPSSPIYLSLRARLDSICNEAIQNGVYRLPDPYPFAGPYESGRDTVSIAVSSGPAYISFQNQAYIRTGKRNDGAYIILRSGQEQHILPTQQNRYSLRPWLSSFGEKYYAPGFKADFAAIYLREKEIYTLQILHISGNERTLFPTHTCLIKENGEVKSFTQQKP
jgi:hypothetical protein